MAEAPELHAYVVTLNFGENAPLTTSIWVAQDQANAVALCTWNFLHAHPVATPLICCIVSEISAERLRHLLRAVEGKLPAGGTADIVSLVRAEARKIGEGHCVHGVFVGGGWPCSKCSPDAPLGAA